MKVKNLILPIGIIMLLATSGCREEGCTDIEATNFSADAKKDDGSCEYKTVILPGNISLMIHAMAGTSALDFSTEYTTASGATIKFTRAQLYLSNLMLDENDSDLAPASPYLLVHNDQHMYDLGVFKASHYHGVSFSIGVDSAQNHLDPSGADVPDALSANNSNFSHWSWNMGYRFITLEGMVDTTANNSTGPNVHFEYHIGTDALLRNVILSHDFEVEEGESETIHLNFDYLKLLDGVDVKNDYLIHSPNATAVVIVDNGPSAFSLRQ